MEESERPGPSDTVRHSFVGALIAGGAMALSGLIGGFREGAPFPEFLQPLGVFVVIAATVGGLAAPLVGRAIRRRRHRSGD